MLTFRPCALAGWLAVVLTAGCGGQPRPPEPTPAATQAAVRLGEGRFWALIAETRGGDRSMDGEAFATRLTDRLARLTPGEIADFDRIWQQKLDAAYRWDLWGAAYVINGGCSDDCFDYFRDFLVSQGRAAYRRALRDPDSLGDLPTDEEAGWEGPGYAALQAYEQVTGGDLPPSGPSPAEPAGRPWEDGGLDELYPRLTAAGSGSAS